MIVQQALVKPTVQGLEDDDNSVQPDDAEGLDYSSPWHDTYLNNREEIRQNLHTLHPSMQVILQMCQDILGKQLLIDASQYRWAYNIPTRTLHCVELAPLGGEFCAAVQWQICDSGKVT